MVGKVDFHRRKVGKGKGDRKLQNHLRMMTVWEAVNALSPALKMATS